MPNSPFNFLVTVYDTDGSTVLANVQVVLRNESTNERQSGNTNSSGEVLFNLANFASGWAIGDRITYYTYYQNTQAYGTYTAENVGGKTVDLVLSSVSAITQLRYFTVQDFLDYYDIPIYEDDTGNGIKAQQVVKVGTGAELEIDSATESKFDNNGGSYYSVTQEYHDGKGDYDTNYFLKKGPIISITTLQSTTNDEDVDSASVTWNTLVENDDFFTDKETSRVGITASTKLPTKGRNRLRATYTYGRASVPEDIKELAIMLTGLRIFNLNMLRNNFQGKGFNPDDMDWFMEYKRNIINKYKRTAILNI